jgi:hypothetical protein
MTCTTIGKFDDKIQPVTSGLVVRFHVRDGLNFHWVTRLGVLNICTVDNRSELAKVGTTTQPSVLYKWRVSTLRLWIMFLIFGLMNVSILVAASGIRYYLLASLSVLIPVPIFMYYVWHESIMIADQVVLNHLLSNVMMPTYGNMDLQRRLVEYRRRLVMFSDESADVMRSFASIARGYAEVRLAEMLIRVSVAKFPLLGNPFQ